ncbi:hypothetical protein GCM10028862_05180 [Luteimonas pelagia]
MQARLIAYPPDAAAVVRHVAAGGSLRIGRGSDCELRLDHPSVSRRHAELHSDGDSWHVRDLGSKNGSFADGARISEATLARETWLRFGDVYCEFTPLTEAQVDADARDRAERRAAITARTARIERMAGLRDLLDDSLRSVVELAQCERGFVLLDEGDGLTVRASLALDPSQLSARTFSGSVGAVRRALRDRQPVVVNDIGSDAWLGQRASVVAAGLSAIACLPLVQDGASFGAIYVDRVRPGPAITDLDLELLQAFVEGAAVWIAAQRAADLLDHAHAAARPDATRWDGIEAAHPETAGHA